MPCRVLGRKDLRERSCRLRCSLRLKARLQNWHLYFFSGADVFLAGELLAVPGAEGAMCVAVPNEGKRGRGLLSQWRRYRSLSVLAPIMKACRRQEVAGMSDHSLSDWKGGLFESSVPVSVQPQADGEEVWVEGMRKGKYGIMLENPEDVEERWDGGGRGGRGRGGSERGGEVDGMRL